MGKSTISMVIFNSKMLVYQSVYNSILMFHRFLGMSSGIRIDLPSENTIPKSRVQHVPGTLSFTTTSAPVPGTAGTAGIAGEVDTSGTTSQRATASLLHQS